MSVFVVEPSVAVKWYVPESHAQSAVKLLDDRSQLHAPDLLFPEFANTLLKKQRRGELKPEEISSILTALETVPLEIHSSQLLLEGAIELAASTGRTVYDSLYVALALLLDCPVVTADEQLVSAMTRADLSSSVQHVAHL